MSSDKIKEVMLKEEMESSYIDYAMSVVIGRAIPDVRDGLKVVHRRIIYAMTDNGYFFNRPHVKSARTVGEVLGKYHPHGDMAVYNSLVRMGQDFSLRYPLIDPQGNFGSIDGDPPAAMRYTESRLSQIANEIIEDLDSETVDFEPNFDESLKEPTFMPSKLPNMLINGTKGIAVGMATSMPPHNLSEICDGISATIDDPDISLEELMEIIAKGKGLPDKVSFAYVDFDFYQPIKVTLEYLHGIMAEGAMIVVDDYDHFSTGAKSAVDEFVADHELHGRRYELSVPDHHFGYFAVLTKTG